MRSFILYTHHRKLLSRLSREDKGDVLDAIFEYADTGQVTVDLSAAAGIVLVIMQEQLDYNAAKYQKTLDARRTNGAKGGRPKGNNAEVNGKMPDICDYASEDETAPKTGREENKRLQERFAVFWQEYPRKVNKKNAMKAWMKLRPSDELVAKIIEAVRQQRATDQWQRDGMAFVPYASTWLNGQRWNDEITPAAPAEPPSTNSSFDADDFFAAALAQTYGQGYGQGKET